MSVNSKSLSPAKRWLLQQMRQMGHGTIQDVIVRGGEPVTSRRPRIKLTYKLGGKRVSAKCVHGEFELKDQHWELFELMEQKQNGTISKLAIQDGLPFLVEWEDD